MLALRARFRNRLVCGSKLALGIARATVERIAAFPGALLHQLAILAIRTLHSDEVLLDVLAIGIPRARCELTVSAVP